MRCNPKQAGSIISVLFILTAFVTFGQGTDSYGDVNNKIIPQPPNVASLLKFNEVPVNYFNGTADIGIPLFNINENSVNIPLSLNYHTGGIRVNEEASWVGLGWNLNAAGIIQEIIVGEPDTELHGFYMDNYNAAPKPNAATNYPATYGDFNNSYNLVESGFCFRNASAVVTSFSKASMTKSNFEYDLFSYNFGGSSGKFILPDYLNGVCLDRQNIIFTKLISPTAGFLAKTPDGTKYYFDIIGYTTTERPCTPVALQPLKTRTWYLSKIIYPDKREVNFSYTMTTARTLPTLNESWFRTEYGANYSSFNTDIYSPSQSYSTVENYWLSAITFPTGKIEFNTSSRLDMENALKLDAIRLFKTGDLINPVKVIKFSYDYFSYTDGSVYNDWLTNTALVTLSICSGQTSYTPTLDQRRKRLKLLKVEVSDGVQLTGLPTYMLEYNSVNLPVKTSLAQDLWGFYNGSTTNVTLLPDYNYLGYWDGAIPYAALNGGSRAGTNGLGIRRANENFAQASTLSKITYPTGGYTRINYESNQIASNLMNNTQIVNNMAKAIDHGIGIQQTEFNVPSIGYLGIDGSGIYYDANPALIQLTLFCCGSNGFNGSGALTCSGSYGPCSYYNALQPNNGLYAKLEYYDISTGQWTITAAHTYDLSNAAIGLHHGELEIHELLKPGRYRITANYPDNSPTINDYSQTIASIIVSYKDMINTTTPPFAVVGGLRVKNISEYNYDDIKLTGRNFAYTNGRMMVMPQFYRAFQPYGNVAATLSADCSTNHDDDNVYNDVKICGSPSPSSFDPAPVVNYKRYSLYSNPVISYTYSAKGALVGYSNVTLTYEGEQSNGKTELLYNCHEDNYNTYSAFTIPGTPTAPYISNGSLKKQTEYKRTLIGFTPVKMTEFEYDVYNPEIRWCFKSEYNPPMSYGYVSDPLHCSMLASNKTLPAHYLAHFYPLKLGKLSVSQKKETSYELADSMIITTSYEYNAKLQMKKTTTTNSKGLSVLEENYFPSDYTSTLDFTKEMRDRNMIDYPLETITRVGGLGVKSVYREYSLHDSMVSLLKYYEFNPSAPVSFTASIPSNSKDNRYELRMQLGTDSYGNTTELAKANDIQQVVIWGYNHAYPVAKVMNSTYSAAFALVNASILNSPASDLQLRTELNKLRTGLPNALVSTYTYRPLVGITSETDANGKTIYYEYDNFQRLRYLKDQDGNIVKTYDYHYKQ